MSPKATTKCTSEMRRLRHAAFAPSEMCAMMCSESVPEPFSDASFNHRKLCLKAVAMLQLLFQKRLDLSMLERYL